MKQREASLQSLIDEIISATAEILRKYFNVNPLEGSARDVDIEIIKEKIQRFIERQILGEKASSSPFLLVPDIIEFFTLSSAERVLVKSILMNELEYQLWARVQKEMNWSFFHLKHEENEVCLI